MKRKDIRDGDIVVVERAGDVVSRSVAVNKNARSRNAPKFIFPNTCPECGSGVDDYDNGVEAIARCSGGDNRPAQQVGKLKHFVEALDIKGFGDKQEQYFYDLGLISKISDIFTLEEKLKNFNLSQLKGWEENYISNFLDSINSRRTITPVRFISSLGIRHV